MTLIVTIETDDCAHMDNPCDWGGWIIHSYNSRHINYAHPDELQTDEIEEKLLTGYALRIHR